MSDEKIVPEKIIKGMPVQAQKKVREENARIRTKKKYGQFRSKYSLSKIEMKESGYWNSFIMQPVKMTLAEAEALDKKRKEEREQALGEKNAN